MLTLEQFLEMVDDDKFFTVTFVKRTNNMVRTMTARRGVKKGVKGVGHSFKPEDKNLLCVYDVNKMVEGTDNRGAFRMINLDALLSCKVHGQYYRWDYNERCFIEDVEPFKKGA